MSDETKGGGSKAQPATPAEVLKFMLRHAPLRVWELDAQGVFLMNDGSPDSEATPGSLVGLNARQAFAYISEGLATVEQALAGVEGRVRFSRDGVVFDLLNTPLFDAHGKVRGVLGIAQIVTERVRAERDARANEERFRRVFESNMIGLLFFRPSGEIVDANDSALATLGYSRADLCAGLLDWRRATAPGYEVEDER